MKLRFYWYARQNKHLYLYSNYHFRYHQIETFIEHLLFDWCWFTTNTCSN